MAIELKPWDSAEFLHDEADVAMYLSIALEDDGGPTIHAAAVRVAARARGGAALLSRESGIAQEELETAMHGTDDQALPVLKQLANAYSRFLADQRVA